MNKLSFEVGRRYSAHAIADVVGGSYMPYLPTSSGRIVAGRFTLEKNPDAPDEVLVQDKPRIMAAARLLYQSGETIPVFLKERNADSGFVYRGRYRCTFLLTDPVEIAKRQRSVPRPLGAYFKLERVGD
jgi:hypothetical protein